MVDFEDRFSKQADRYRQFRPSYPDALFEHLAERSPDRTLAWDCATGNGQAASKLAYLFDHVIATDASTSQIKNALDLKGVEFRVAQAEDCGLKDSSVSLVTVANALHWFDKEKFFDECNRVLKPGGLFAAWCYEAFRIDEPYQEAFNPIYKDISPYWSSRLKDLREHYTKVELPMEEMEAPAMEMCLQWNLRECLGFLRSWSACQTYIDENGTDPTESRFDNACAVWGDPDQPRTVRWNLHIRIGRKPD